MNLPGVTGQQIPPQLSAGPANVGPVTVPQGNPGNISAAIKKILAGVQLFQDALPSIPMGSPIHAKLLKMITEVSKEVQSIGDHKGGDVQGQIQALLQMAKNSAQSAPMSAMSRMFPAANQNPGTPPAMTPPAAPAAGAA